MDEAPTPAKIAYYRKSILERCLKYRSGKTILPEYREFAKQLHRREQLNLVKLRIWRATGAYPRDDH